MGHHAKGSITEGFLQGQCGLVLKLTT
jgi:hypothetical protein